ncbi:lamin tail domain-containing protein [Halomarina salina]|uniref:Lamin tail domain-containing protein n=1 Tax=Halomarina salina TaxID=1872699 RepID=A0ABD5RM18_9EURY|nr:DUF4350 domain-containing protein [Halomarina salina]
MPERIAAGTSHRVDVVDVTDGDTVDVQFPDGGEEEVRIIGLDTPETKRNQRFERVQEWEGIEDPQTLVEWGEEAKAFARERLSGATVTLSFDPSEPVRDQFGRLLCYLEYDRDGGRTFYNRELLAEGLARVYDSGVTNHDAFRAVEREARDENQGLWTESDPAATPPVRNRAVAEVYVPHPTSVRTDSGPLPQDRAPVKAEASATQELLAADAVSYDDAPIPLVGVDEEARVGMVGGLLPDEIYEGAEGFPVDTSTYEPYVFLTNLLTWLSDREGSVLVDGGHGQFGVDYALSAEDAAYYQRYLEGQGIAFEQRNRLSASFLDRGRTLLVTNPVGRFGAGELDRLREFRDDGGAVVLLGSATAPAFVREHLNEIAAALDSDLRANADRVRDDRHALDDDPTLPTTARFDRSLPLFGAYGAGGAEGQTVALELADVTADPPGDDRDSLAEETVTLANRGDAPLDLTGWALSDLAGRSYAFPDEFELGAGDRVTVHSGAGTDTERDLYWDAGRPVWNNRGDTVVVTDEEDVELLRTTY